MRNNKIIKVIIVKAYYKASFFNAEKQMLFRQWKFFPRPAKYDLHPSVFKYMLNFKYVLISH